MGRSVDLTTKTAARADRFRRSKGAAKPRRRPPSWDRPQNFKPVVGCTTALLCPRPAQIPQAKLKGSPAKGMTFQRALGRELLREFGPQRTFLSQWITYYDQGGIGFAEIDAFILGDEWVLCLEAKLTQKDFAFEQMERRYVPLLRALYGLPVATLQVCKNVVQRIEPGRARTARSLFQSPEPGRFTWHWLP